ncbi:hypothetical protein ONZ45_g15860 [Pleurotus djamor]|nr:hypothetical protein ONZ45_g15860 [Pleurotus djamor]
MVLLLSSVFLSLSLITNFAAFAAIISAETTHESSAMKTYKFGEYTIITVTRPVDDTQLDILNNHSKTSLVPLTPLEERRANLNACRATRYSALCGIITTSAPFGSDCEALQNYIFALADQTAAAASPPCNNPYNCDCPNFSVKPGYQQIFTLGTCSWTLINREEPSGADTVFENFANFGYFLVPVYNLCIIGTQTGGFAVPEAPSGLQGKYAFG